MQMKISATQHNIAFKKNKATCFGYGLLAIITPNYKLIRPDCGNF